jgi:hypothetical protein
MLVLMSLMLLTRLVGGWPAPTDGSCVSRLTSSPFSSSRGREEEGSLSL